MRPVFLFCLLLLGCQRALTGESQAVDSETGVDSVTSLSSDGSDDSEHWSQSDVDTDSDTDSDAGDGDSSVSYQVDTDSSRLIPDEDARVPYDTSVDPDASFDFDFSGVPFVGVNMSGPEWDGGATLWPNQYLTKGYASYLKWFRAWGMNTVRLPFRWEYLQQALGGELDPDELYALELTVFHLKEYRANVLIDMHNYARYDGDVIGSEGVSYDDYADVWRRLAEIFKPYPEVMFGIMNEPHDMDSAQWVTAANAAIAAIRDTGAKNLIFINGNGWSGAHSWDDTWTDASGDLPNAEAMLQVVDPLGDDYLIFEVHQYLNIDSSDWGQCECAEWETAREVDAAHPDGCTNETVGSYRLFRFTQWLRENGKMGFLGEFGALDDATCIAAIDDMLNFIEDNDDVWVGWAWWSAGPGCASWQDPIDPTCWKDERISDLEANGVDGDLVYAQVKVLKKHLDTY